MSLCHIQLKKIKEDSDKVIYLAISPDFNDAFEDENVAEIIVNKRNNEYEFLPGKKWVEQKTIPPHFYSRPKEEQDKLLKSQYLGYGNGAWTMKINIWISNIITRGEYPDKVPE